MDNKKRIMLIANEASGDHHGADLVAAIKAQRTDCEFYGVGGQKMRDAGVEILHDLTSFSVIGATDAIRHLRIFHRVYKNIIATIERDKPDAVVLIDAPSFNLRIAKNIQHTGVKVIYYISPQIWAWKASRIHLIKRCIDLMAVILPFEKAIYDKAEVPAIFTGHPLANSVKASKSVSELQDEFDLDINKRTIGILPGSRRKELSRLLPVMLTAAKRLKQRYPDLQFILPLANTLSRDDLAPYLKNVELELKVIDGRTYDVVSCCHSVMACSGTATLEVALLNKPMVIIYKTTFLTVLILAFLMKSNYVGLPNVLANEEIVPELLHLHATAGNLTKRIAEYLDDESYYQETVTKLQRVSDSLQSDSADMTLADAITEML